MKRQGATKKIVKQRSVRPSPVVVRAFLSVFLLVALVFGGVWLSESARDPAYLPIRTVQIQGEFRYLQSEDLERVVADVATGGFFTVDVDAVREVAASLPWVDGVTVRRVWPDTLRVSVTEQKAAAAWGSGGLVNVRGELFHALEAPLLSELPMLAGPDEQRKSILEQYRRMNKLVVAAGHTVKRLVQDARGAWQMEWNSGVTVNIGRSDPYPRLDRFMTVLSKLARPQAQLVSADLRYSNGFALRWQALEQNG